MKRHELIVIGAGPAGLSAAIEAKKNGMDVIVFDENARPGGQLFKQIHKFFGSKEHHAKERGFQIGEDLLKEAEDLGVQVKLNSVVMGIYNDKEITVRNGNEVDHYKGDYIIIATGAAENMIPFKGWDTPGVIGAGAAQALMNLQGVQPGKRILMVGSGNVGLVVSFQLMQAGCEVAALIDAAPRVGGYGVHASKVARTGVPFYTSHTIVEAKGGDHVTSAIIAEVDDSRIDTRYTQGWVSHRTDSLEEPVAIAREHQTAGTPCAVAYHGNIVDLLEYLYDHNIHVDLMSDQTSCHVPYDGGYCPQGLTFEQRTEMLAEDPEDFRKLVDKSLQHHIELIEKFHDRGTYFFDYGNSFLKAVYDTGVKSICKNGENDLDGFIFPSYVEDILGPCLFDYGYGPFRWCCLSRDPKDLEKTDKAAAEYIKAHNRRYQDYDNYVWVRDAQENKLVVGTQCRILYQDAMGRMNIALKFNEMVRNGEIGPVILGRDHHDTGGTDAPFRETSNIKDGSNIMAEMATQCYAGNAARGMSYIALHNGGGTGIGRAINGGFGMVLDGSERVDNILKMSMPWDTMVGVARRSWARNEHAMTTAAEYNKMYAGQDHITMPYVADDDIVAEAVKSMKK